MKQSLFNFILTFRGDMGVMMEKEYVCLTNLVLGSGTFGIQNPLPFDLYQRRENDFDFIAFQGGYLHAREIDGCEPGLYALREDLLHWWAGLSLRGER